MLHTDLWATVKIQAATLTIYIHGIFVEQAIFPVSTNSWGSRTSNSWTLSAVNIALSSVMLISVQCSRGVVDVFLFAHCTLTAGLVIPILSRKTRLEEVVHAFLGRQLLVVAPINLASINIAMKERYHTAALFLCCKSFNITLQENRRNCWITARHQRQTTKRELLHDCFLLQFLAESHW